MHFDGYRVLPRSHLLEAFDYFSFHDGVMYVASTSGDIFQVVPGSSGETVRQIAGAGQAHGVAFDPESGLGFSTHSGSNSVDVFSPSDLLVRRHISVADDPDGILYEPWHKLIYAMSGDARVANVIDPATETLVGTVSLGGKPESAVYDEQNHVVYQNLVDKHALATVDLGTSKVLGTKKLVGCDGPSGIGMDQLARRLFIACSRSGKMLVYDPDQQRVIASVATVSAVDVLDYDAEWHRIYLAGSLGVLAVVAQDGADAYRLIDIVRTHFGAHSLGVDPVSHKVYVGYAGLLVAPRFAVFTPKKP